MVSKIKQSKFFIANGTLPANSPSYIKRTADDMLFDSIRAGKLSYVFAPHDTGKSSLMSQTAWRLNQEGVATAIVSLSGIDADLDIEHLYLWFIRRLQTQLDLAVDPKRWWAEQTTQAQNERLATFMQEVVAAKLAKPTVIFIDDITHKVVSLDFFKGLMDAIQSTDESSRHSLTFVLLGVVTLSELKQRHNQPVLDHGQKIELHDFSRPDITPYQEKLGTIHPEGSEIIFDRIYHWTKGHPYLTQKIFSTVAEVEDVHWNDERVDSTVSALFFSPTAQIDPNLQSVESTVSTSLKQKKLATLYRQILETEQTVKDEESPEYEQLKLTGLVRNDNGTLQIRNEIYREAFGKDWIEANLSTGGFSISKAALIVFAILLVGAAGYYFFEQRQNAIEAQSIVDEFNAATSSQERMVILASLLGLGGYETTAHEIFYEQLSPNDQLALFSLDNPEAVNEELTTVVRGLYTAPQLENDKHGDAILLAMMKPLKQLKYSPALGSVELELEIDQRLKGRELYRDQSDYTQAIQAYNTAIQMNTSNPGTYFERGLAYAGLGSLNLALNDLKFALSLDGRWETSIREVLTDNPQLYTALWSTPAEYQALVAMVPTPTSTPTPTFTPSPTSTSKPTFTLAPPTSTPLPTATFTPVPALVLAQETPTDTPPPRPTSSPTPSAPNGAFTLLNPLALDKPSYGPTTFEWKYSEGPLPSEYGFEVRVWKAGNYPTGVHNAVLDNKNGNIENMGGNRYQLTTNIEDAYGVKGKSGEYLWSVAVVQIDPEYEDISLQSEPAKMRFEAIVSGGGGDGDDKGGGGSTSKPSID